MTNLFDGSAHDPTLQSALHSSDSDTDLQSNSGDTGPDELGTLDPRASIMLTSHAGSATVAELVEYNVDNKKYPPGMPPPGAGEIYAEFFSVGRVFYGELVTAFSADTAIVLRHIEVTKSGPFHFELARVDSSTVAPALHGDVSDQSMNDMSGELFHLLDIGDWGAISGLLQRQYALQTGHLDYLRSMSNAHRDAVQNAVDAVQTKRLEFGERGTDSTIVGSVMALVSEVALVVIPGLYVGRILGSLAKGLSTLSRRGGLLALPQGVLPGSPGTPLVGKLNILDQKLTIRTVDINRTKIRNRGKTIYKRAVQKRRATVDVRVLIAEESMQQADRITEVLTSPGAIEITKTVIAHSTKPLREEVGDSPINESPSAPRISSTGNKVSAFLPIDVAMKMEVQNFFDGWICEAEAAQRVLSRYILLTQYEQELTQQDFAVLETLMLENSEISGLLVSDEVVSERQDVLKASLETDYELLIWVLTYFHEFLSDVTGERVGFFGPSSSTFKAEEYQISIPTKLRPVVRYLAFRFFPDLGAAVEAAPWFSLDDEILRPTWLTVHEMAKRIAGLISSPDSVAMDGGVSPASDVGVVIQQALSSVRVGVRNPARSP